MKEDLSPLVRRARQGDGAALNELAAHLIDGVYRLGLRMTGNRADAEDAAQEILIKVVTHLGEFRGDASVRTWAYRIAVRHLLDQKKTRIETTGIDFERFAADLMDGLEGGAVQEDPAAAEEVKLACSLAMLVCLDREHRVAYILGEIFDLPPDSAATVAGVSAEAYRQRLSRARRQLQAFTESHCGIVNADAACRCDRRVKRAAELGRIDRQRLDLVRHPAAADLRPHVKEMEALHATAALFRGHPDYAAPDAVAAGIRELLEPGGLRILDEPGPG
jgi:RNA polymerase sigma factor (sigma-70 family)